MARDDDLEEEKFDRTVVRVDTSELVLTVDVNKIAKKIELTGIAGRRWIDVDGARQIIDALEEAMSFLERNAPARHVVPNGSIEKVVEEFDW